MEEEQKELWRLYKLQQEKYVYYIIALSVTAIGFSIYNTTGVNLKLIQIPLGISILCWGLSIYCGLTFLNYIISSLYTNLIYLEFTKNHNVGIEKVKADFNDTMSKSSEKTSKLLKWQVNLFYSGIVLFIIWHILEMYQK